MRATLARIGRNRVFAGLAHRFLTGYPVLLTNAVHAVRLLPSFAQLSRLALVDTIRCLLRRLGRHFYPVDGLCGSTLVERATASGRLAIEGRPDLNGPMSGLTSSRRAGRALAFSILGEHAVLRTRF